MGGRDKLSETVGGVPLLRKQAIGALATGHEVFVALPSPGHNRMRHIADLAVTPLVVPEAAEGLSGTLRGAVAQLPDCDGFLVVLADLPLIGENELQAVIAMRTAHPEALIWRGATEDGRPGHPIAFDASLRPEFAGIEGDSGGDAVVRAHSHRVVTTPLTGEAARLDLDTPEDWAAFRAATAL